MKKRLLLLPLLLCFSSCGNTEEPAFIPTQNIPEWCDTFIEDGYTYSSFLPLSLIDSELELNGKCFSVIDEHVDCVFKKLHYDVLYTYDTYEVVMLGSIYDSLIESLEKEDSPYFYDYRVDNITGFNILEKKKESLLQIDTEHVYSDDYSEIKYIKFEFINVKSAELYSFELTEDESWSSEDLDLFNQYLGFELPFMKFSSEYIWDENFDETGLSFWDSYYYDLSENYINLLLNDDFTYNQNTDSYQKNNKNLSITWDVFGNHIEIE